MNTSPQHVRWGPSDGKSAGISVWNEGSSDQETSFIAWSELLPELHSKLLPQLFADPSGFQFKTVDYHGKRNWLVRLFDPADAEFCGVWFGGNPDKQWEFDGLVHVGDPLGKPHVWQSYQRHADGTYRRIRSTTATLDEMKRR